MRRHPAAPSTQPDAKSKTDVVRRKDGEEAWQPEYGSLVWLMQHGLRLCAPRVRSIPSLPSPVLLWLHQHSASADEIRSQMMFWRWLCYLGIDYKAVT